MVTRDEVIYAFRFLLGRDPESVAVIELVPACTKLGKFAQSLLGMR